MHEGGAVGGWIRKSLIAGDDPEIVKAVLKKHGHDPQLVDIIMQSMAVKGLPQEKKQGFKISFPAIPRIDFALPKVTLPRPSLQSIKWTIIALFVVIALAVALFALDWYADYVAARVVL